MIRQAQIYFAGAVSGTALIGTAVVAFVLLVSMQALKDWPLAGLGLGGDDSSQSVSNRPARPAGAHATHPGSAAPVAGRARSLTGGGNDASHRGVGSGTGATRAGEGAGPGQSPSSPGAAPQPGAPSGAGAPDGSSTTSASGGSPESNPAGGSGGGSKSSGAQSPSGAISGAVNETVKGVDEATGGVVGETGVTKATEEVVNGVAGPESVVGKTVDETVETVGGLLGGNR